MRRGISVGALLSAALACAPEAREETGWEAVRNPILAFDDAAVKDAFAIRRGDEWLFGYSYIKDDPFRFRLGFSRTKDLRTFAHEPPVDDAAVGGLASPTVAVAPDGTYVMTYNSHTRDVGDTANKLYYKTSRDLRVWSDPTRIHVEGADAPADRLIDAAIAFAPNGVLLFFKREQTSSVAFAASIESPFTLLGPTEPASIENVQVLAIDGVYHLLATSLPLYHRPVLHRLAGDPTEPASFRTWTRVRELEIEEQTWNTGEGFLYERANASYLVDERANDGFFYLVYAGSTELRTYAGRGHAKLGVSRSRDLVTWEPARE